jgi:branched-chain amino acid transport system permease protein
MLSTGLFVTIILNGITFSILLFLLAAGLEIMFGVMRIINLAHGSFYMFGAYIGIITVQATGSFLLGILAGMATGACLGIITDRLFFQRTPESLQQVILTLGIVYIVSDICRSVWGGNPIGITLPNLLAGSVSFGTMVFPVYRLLVVVVGLLIAAGLWVFQERTLLGAIIRAGVDDSEMVSGFGINIRVLKTSVFAFGSLLAGFAGVVGSPILFVYPRVSWDILVLSLMVVVVGGMGSLPGALLGSLIIGLTDSIGKFFIPQAANVVSFSVLVIFLILKPSGIFGVGRKN